MKIKNTTIKIHSTDFFTKHLEKERFRTVVSYYMSSSDDNEMKMVPIKSTLLEEEPEVIDLIQTYVKHLPRILKQLEETLQEENWEKLKDLAHQTKGTGGNYGFMAISEIAEIIEFKALNQNKEEIKGLLNRMEHVCNCIYMGIESTESDNVSPITIKE